MFDLSFGKESPVKTELLSLSRPQRCVLGVALLAIALTAVRTLALFLAFDAEIGYFVTGAPLAIILYILEGLAVALSALLFFLSERKTDEALPVPLSRTLPVTVGAGASALLALACACTLLTTIGQTPAPRPLIFLAVICAAIGAGYFVTCAIAPFRRVQAETSAIFGFLAVLALAMFLAVIYFDRYTQMNAPHKMALQCCFLAAMLALLMEIRVSLGKGGERARAAFCALAALLCGAVGISDTVAYIAGIYRDTLYLLFDLLCVALAVYSAARLCALCFPAPNEKRREDEQV